MYHAFTLMITLAALALFAPISSADTIHYSVYTDSGYAGDFIGNDNILPGALVYGETSCYNVREVSYNLLAVGDNFSDLETRPNMLIDYFGDRAVCDPDYVPLPECGADEVLNHHDVCVPIE